MTELFDEFSCLWQALCWTQSIIRTQILCTNVLFILLKLVHFRSVYFRETLLVQLVVLHSCFQEKLTNGILIQQTAVGSINSTVMSCWDSEPASLEQL